MYVYTVNYWINDTRGHSDLIIFNMFLSDKSIKRCVQSFK